MKPVREVPHSPASHDAGHLALSQPISQPIEMKLAADTLWQSLGWVVGCWFGAFILFDDPGLLWTRVLAYPVAIGMLLFSLFSCWGLWSEWRQRLVASPQGIEWRGELGDQVV